MWEKISQETQAQTAQPLFRRPAREESDGVLLMQSALCLVAVLAAVALRAFAPPLWAQVRESGNRMLTAGIGFEQDTEFSRFASAAVREAETALDELLRSGEDGIGGFTGIALENRTVPDGATIERIELSREFTLPLSGRITSPFGFRTNPLTGADEFHLGTDLSAAIGTPVLAASEGQVTKSGYSSARGNYIIIRHGGGVQTLYQHLSCGLVRAGEVVQEGQLIALSGDTGDVTGPHLHLELLVDGICVDPACAFPELDG